MQMFINSRKRAKIFIKNNIYWYLIKIKSIMLKITVIPYIYIFFFVTDYFEKYWKVEDWSTFITSKGGIKHTYHSKPNSSAQNLKTM